MEPRCQKQLHLHDERCEETTSSKAAAVCSCCYCFAPPPLRWPPPLLLLLPPWARRWCRVFRHGEGKKICFRLLHKGEHLVVSFPLTPYKKTHNTTAFAPFALLTLAELDRRSRKVVWRTTSSLLKCAICSAFRDNWLPCARKGPWLDAGRKLKGGCVQLVG